MTKVVLKLDLHDDKSHKKVMKVVSTLSGFDLLTIDTKEKTLTVIGNNINPSAVVGTMMKSGRKTEILTVERAEEEKKAEPKKEEAKKKEPKKEEAKKKEKKKEEEKKEEAKKEDMEISNTSDDNHVSNDQQIAVYSPYYNPNMNQHYYGRVVEEHNPPGCVIS